MCTLVIIWLILKAQQFSFSFQIQYVLIIITLFTKSKEVKLLYREQTYLSLYNNIVLLLTIIIFHVGYIQINIAFCYSKLKMNYLPIKNEIFGHSFHLF